MTKQIILSQVILVIQMCVQVPVCCNKIIADVSDEDQFHWKRRDILKCFGATVGLVRPTLLSVAANFCIIQFNVVSISSLSLYIFFKKKVYPFPLYDYTL